MNWIAPTPGNAQPQRYASCDCAAPENPVKTLTQESAKAMGQILEVQTNAFTTAVKIG